MSRPAPRRPCFGPFDSHRLHRGDGVTSSAFVASRQKRPARPTGPLVEVGYGEDGVIWLTNGDRVESAADAERRANRDAGQPRWKAVEQTSVGPTGAMFNTKDEAWEQCGPRTPGPRRSW